jgi:predicted DNA-binding transcriptional regulator AlpA
MAGLTASALDREVRAGRFPAPFKLSPEPHTRAIGWSLRSVQAWIEQREQTAQAA